MKEEPESSDIEVSDKETSTTPTKVPFCPVVIKVEAEEGNDDDANGKEHNKEAPKDKEAKHESFDGVLRGIGYFKSPDTLQNSIDNATQYSTNSDLIHFLSSPSLLAVFDPNYVPDAVFATRITAEERKEDLDTVASESIANNNTVESEEELDVVSVNALRIDAVAAEQPGEPGAPNEGRAFAEAEVNAEADDFTDNYIAIIDATRAISTNSAANLNTFAGLETETEAEAEEAATVVVDGIYNDADNDGYEFISTCFKNLLT